MGSDPITGPCTICGRRPTGLMEVSLRGELTCVEHRVSGRCVFCGRPRPSRQRARG